MKHYKLFWIIILFNAIFSFKTAIADVLKPALVEATIYPQKVVLQMTLNIESILSGISTNLINTQESENEDAYQQLRALPKEELEQKFLQYQDTFKQNFTFAIDGKKADFILSHIKIDDIGYTKRARKSLLTFETRTAVKEQISWNYFTNYGNSAFRFRFFQEDAYTWNTWQIIQDTLTIEVENFRPRTSLENLAKFIVTGFYHVIPLGLDHILFIVAMSLSVLGLRARMNASNFWKMFGLVSSFTLAHTITLGLASSGVVTANPEIIEPLIAASIALVAISNLFLTYHHIREIIVVFIFGLLHGLGFALMLKSFINDKFISSLIGFNVGVELAQILVVIATVLSIFILVKIKIKQLFITIPINVVIAGFGASMLLERI
jgi:hypothetical protein